MRLGDLAERLGGREITGDAGFEVSGVGSLDEGGPGELGFVRSEAYAAALGQSEIGAVIAPPGVAVGSRPVIRSHSPNLDIARAAELLAPGTRPEPGIHPTAVVDPVAEVDPGASVGALAVVGARSVIGAGTVVHPRVTIYPDVRIGADCEFHAGVIVREGTEIGDRVILQPGAVLGGDGFGYEFDEHGSLEKVPQVGMVIVEDDVEIGSNSTVDRARFGATRIGRGVKIDNLVMVGHNCEIGEGSALVALTGLAGSTVVGKRVFFMAQSGAGNHTRIGDGSFVGARAGVIEDLPAGSRVWGFPAMPERAWHRAMSVFGRLPDMMRRLRSIEKSLGKGE
ncbi:MAG: UDP-3-O-(3-hydroxymyristoyl)glucosamine N-acyltransferase [Myxococcota bacterium]